MNALKDDLDLNNVSYSEKLFESEESIAGLKEPFVSVLLYSGQIGE